jgi:hypothetical protein
MHAFGRGVVNRVKFDYVKLFTLFVSATAISIFVAMVANTFPLSDKGFDFAKMYGLSFFMSIQSFVILRVVKYEVKSMSYWRIGLLLIALIAFFFSFMLKTAVPFYFVGFCFFGFGLFMLFVVDMIPRN